MWYASIATFISWFECGMFHAPMHHMPIFGTYDSSMGILFGGWIIESRPLSELWLVMMGMVKPFPSNCFFHDRV